MRINPIVAVDSYKHSHFLQLPPETEHLTAYIEARSGGMTDEVIFFGLTMFLKDVLSRRIGMTDIGAAEAICEKHGLPFNRQGWVDIIRDHGGYLPLSIQALPEGSRVRCGVPLIQVTNTAPGFAWLVTFIETKLLRAIW